MKKKLQSVFEEMLWIPEYLSRGVHSLQKISMEQDDIKQELRMALWLSLRKYVSLIKEGRKPQVDIRRYCHLACINKKIDLIRKTLRDKAQYNFNVSDFDVGKYDSENNIHIDIDNLVIMVDGINILIFEEDEMKKMLFKDFIIGFSYKELSFNYGITVSMVKNYIHQTRLKIRNQFFKLFGINIENFIESKTLYYTERSRHKEDL